MRRWISLLFVLLGASILILTVYNVQVGVVKDIYSENTPRYKLDFPAFITSDECTDKKVAAGFAKGNPAECARSTGVWETPDFIGVGIAIGFLILSRKFKSNIPRSRGGSTERKLRRKRRNARIKFGFGLGLLSFGFADLNGLTTPNGSLDWSAIIGVPTPSISIDLSLILYGSFFMYKSMRFLSKTSEAAEMFSEAKRKRKNDDNIYFEGGKRSRSKFKGGLESLGKSNATVSDLYNQLGLSDFEDDFERNLYDDFGPGGMVAGRTCHLCNGQGCARCNQTGMLN
mgnify:CR=1 FL=1|tara:strand:+ start:18292 stop:19149 length:858 start_codon:yes stop_codon:yes gene_type:complete